MKLRIFLDKYRTLFLSLIVVLLLLRVLAYYHIVLKTHYDLRKEVWHLSSVAEVLLIYYAVANFNFFRQNGSWRMGRIIPFALLCSLFIPEFYPHYLKDYAMADYKGSAALYRSLAAYRDRLLTASQCTEVSFYYTKSIYSQCDPELKEVHGYSEASNDSMQTFMYQHDVKRITYTNTAVKFVYEGAFCATILDSSGVHFEEYKW